MCQNKAKQTLHISSTINTISPRHKLHVPTRNSSAQKHPNFRWLSFPSLSY